MELIALKPLALETLVFRSAEGAFRLTIIAKATFDLRSGELIDPDPIRADVLHDNGRSLRVASDLVPRRGRADVTFAGRAHATHVRFAVLPRHGAPLLDKRLRIVSPPVPLTYEHAFGGASSKTNPVGTATPTIVDPSNEKRTAGFGPVPSTWWWRSRLLQEHDLATILSLRAIPRDLDFAFFNAAPPDQQVAFLVGDETIELEGLTEGAALRVTLPGLRAFARFEGSDVPLVADTLVVDGDSLHATLTFRGDVPIANETAVGRIVATLATDSPDFGPIAGDISRRTAEHPPRTTEHVPVLNVSRFVPFTMQTRMRKDTLIAIVKGTFDLVDDAPAKLATRQVPPLGDTRYADTESIRYPSDFVPFKPRADVLLVGHAHSGIDPTVAHVQLHFGDLRRSIAVFGDRTWQSLGAQGKPAPFKTMPLRWERAYGGPLSEKNPLGRGKGTAVLLPNLERLEALVTSPDSDPEPASFGPIDPEWRARRSKLGTYGARWLATRWPYFPDDFDWGYFNCAPREQQVAWPQGDERYELFGVTEGGGSLAGRLPVERPRAFAALSDGRFVEIVLRIDTVHFDTDQRQVTVVHRGLLETSDADASEVSAVFVVDEALSIEEAHERYLAAAHRPAPPPRKAAPIEIRVPPPKRKTIEAWVRDKALAGKDLTGGDLRNLDLSGHDLRGAMLARSDLRGATLARANLDDANLGEVLADGVDFSGASLARADLHAARLDGANFTDATLLRANLRSAVAKGAKLSDAKADGATFAHAILDDARFERASLLRADFSFAALDRLSFVSAVMDDAKLYDTRGTGVCFDRASLRDARFDRAELTGSFAAASATGLCAESAVFDGSTFLGSNLAGALLIRARLRDVILSKCDLRSAILRKADLTGAKLLKANAMGASFEGAILERTDFRGANLYGAETYRARIANANFEHAHIVGTKLSG